MNTFKEQRLKDINQVRKWIKETPIPEKEDDKPVWRSDIIRKTMLVQGSTKKRAEEYLALVLGE